jgi:hypothetical protein
MTYLKILEIIGIYFLGVAMSLSCVLWVGSGIENENTQIAAAFLGLVGLGISFLALVTLMVCPKPQRRKNGSEKTGN